MRKRFLVFSLVAILVLSVCVFTACGDNGNSGNSDNTSDTPSTPTVNDYLLHANVDYTRMEFSALSSEEVKATLENPDLNSTDGTTTHLLFNFNAKASLYSKPTTDDSATTQATVEEKDIDMTFAATRYESGNIDDMIFIGKIGNDSVSVEFDSKGLCISYDIDSKKAKYNIDVEQFVADYYLEVYGLTAEQTAQMKEDYYKSLETDDNDSSTTVAPSDTIKLLVGGAMNYGAIQVSTAQKDQLKYVKVEVNGQNLYTFITTAFGSMLQDIANMMQLYLYGINQLVFYATTNAGYLVDARADVDIDAPATIMYLPFSSLTKTFWESILHPDWLGDAKPVSEKYEYLQAEYLAMGLVSQVLPDINELSNQMLKLKGNVKFRLTRSALKKSISPNSCRDLTWSAFIAPYLEALNKA